MAAISLCRRWHSFRSPQPKRKWGRLRVPHVQTLRPLRNSQYLCFHEEYELTRRTLSFRLKSPHKNLKASFSRSIATKKGPNTGCIAKRLPNSPSLQKPPKIFLCTAHLWKCCSICSLGQDNMHGTTQQLGASWQAGGRPVVAHTMAGLLGTTWRDHNNRPASRAVGFLVEMRSRW